MIDQENIEKLRVLFPTMHPLAFHRSVERAESVAALFTILETFPAEYPVAWDEASHRWKGSDDLSLSDRFNFYKGREL